MVKREITFTLNSRKFWSRPITGLFVKYTYQAFIRNILILARIPCCDYGKIYLLSSNKKNHSPFLQWGFKTVFVNPTIMASMLPIVFVQMNVKNFWQHVYVYSLMEWCVLEPFASSIAAADTHGFWPKNCCRCGGGIQASDGKVVAGERKWLMR